MVPIDFTAWSRTVKETRSDKIKRFVAWTVVAFLIAMTAVGVFTAFKAIYDSFEEIAKTQVTLTVKCPAPADAK